MLPGVATVKGAGVGRLRSLGSMALQVEPLAPYAAALRDWHAGDHAATLRLTSSLGEDDTIPVSVFFRSEADFFPFERYAVDLCRGRILDAGAGTGVHSLPLQERGFDVTAVERLDEAVGILRARGVRQVVHGDMFALEEPPYDTILMLMNGIGPVGTLAGLERFLAEAGRLVAPGGQVLVDSGAAQPTGSADPTDWPPPTPDAYTGEAWIRLGYDGVVGMPFRELYVDERTLCGRAERAGWGCTVVFEGEGGYLARLVR